MTASLTRGRPTGNYHMLNTEKFINIGVLTDVIFMNIV